MDPNTKYQLMGLVGLGGLGGVMAYYLRAKVDIWRASRGAEVSNSQAPMNILLQIVQNKEREAVELRTDMKLIITNHLEHDRQEREAVIKALVSLEGTQRELVNNMREDRETSAEQRRAIHERITQIAIQHGVPRP